MKGLMISSDFNDKILNGGMAINKRNYMVLNKCCKNLDLFIVKKKKRSQILYEIITAKNFYGINLNDIENIIESIEINHYDFCFIGSSLAGNLVYHIKKRIPKIKVIVFFHNLEYKYFTQIKYLKVTSYKFLFRCLLAFVAKNSEKLSIEYADKIISLNDRDAKEIEKFYKRKVDLIFPTTFEDMYINKYRKNIDIKNSPKILLFVGSDFWANFHGINWFIENVLDSLDNVILYVVGKGTEAWKEKFKNINNLNIVGSVDDLGKYYILADAVISPIFKGSGMKTKTAEALMYGKYIFGTKEAFEGYDLDFSKIGGLCYNEEDFIEKINNHFKVINNNYNEYSRKIFLEKYDTKRWIGIMEKFLYKN